MPKEKIKNALSGVGYEIAINSLKQVEDELRRKNGLGIMEVVSRFAAAHPKIKEPSNSYKKK